MILFVKSGLQQRAKLIQDPGMIRGNMVLNNITLVLTHLQVNAVIFPFLQE